MDSDELGSKVNLRELRGQLVSRVANLLICASGSLGLLLLRQDPFPVVLEVALIVLLGLGIGVRMLVKSQPALARHLLVWGLAAELLAAMAIFPQPWLPFVGLLLTFISAMLVPGSQFAATGATAVLAAVLTGTEQRPYPLPGLLAVLVCGAVSAWLAVRTLYTALDWAWVAQERADRLLEESRDSRGSLSRAAHSLEKTNWILLRTQRELAFARRQAEEARLLKEQFAANVSHELRTPLNIILGFSEIMYVSPELYGDIRWPPALREDIYQIYSSSRHLLEMIDDVLDLSRLEIVGFTLHKELSALEPVLTESVEMISDLFRAHGTCLEVSIASDLPAVEIDRTRVRQVVLNLLNNAARFTSGGRVRLEARREDSRVVVSVEDSGPGIATDRLPHLFSEFYQADRSLQRKHGGVGLGLAISKHFVEAHDGQIWVESQQGHGSTFSFSLPIPDEYVPVSQLRPADHMAHEERDPSSPPVLVVDHDQGVADLVRRHLEGYQVVWVEDAEQLHEAVLMHHPRAIIHNVSPGQSCSAVDNVPVPTVQCSLPSHEWLAEDLAVEACMTKPITPQRLLREIDRVGGVHDILIVDDDWGFCQLMARMLGTLGAGFQVRLANDGSEGLIAMQERAPDLVLLDLVMSGTDGFQVLKEMRADAELSRIPVVLLTATSYLEDALRRYSNQMVIQRAGGLGLNDVLRCLRAVIGVLEPRYDERSSGMLTA